MNNKELVKFAERAIAEIWGYVGGGNGELYTPELAAEWARTRSGHPDSYYLKDCARWLGHRVADCSGLIIAAIRSMIPKYQDQTADTLYSRCAEKGPIKTLPEIPGLCVWKRGHIGIYIGGGYVIESRGYKYGVVMTKLKSRPWTNWGKLRDIEYDNIPAKGDDDVIKKGDRNESVRAWQNALLAANKTLPKYGADADFGSETESATMGFQKDVGLPQTGIVDAATAAAMWKVLLAKAGDTSKVAALEAKIAAGIKVLTA